MAWRSKNVHIIENDQQLINTTAAAVAAATNRALHNQNYSFEWVI